MTGNRRILLVHGPNLNLLPKRDASHYGHVSLQEIETLVSEAGTKYGYDLETFQSNHEGALIDWLQKESPGAAGIIINPGALTHYSYALHDALLDTKLPCVEVHLSDVSTREEWRRTSVTAPACIAQVSGKGAQGYVEALNMLQKKLTIDTDN